MLAVVDYKLSVIHRLENVTVRMVMQAHDVLLPNQIYFLFKLRLATL